jgi:tetratricopeptide (TPR) repeat protein
VANRNTIDKSSDWSVRISEGKNAGKGRNLKLSADKFEQAYRISRGFAPDDKRRGESAYYLAYARYVAKNNVEAAKLFQEALNFMTQDKDPESLLRCSQIHSILAAIFFHLSELDNAEHHIRSAIELEHQLQREGLENLQLLSAILAMRHKYDEALPVFEKLIELQARMAPDSLPETLNMMSYICKELGDAKSQLKWEKERLRVKEMLAGGPEVGDGPLLLVPEGWGFDRLSHFIESARTNQLATYAEEPAAYAELWKLNERFWTTRRNLPLRLLDMIVADKSDNDFSDIAFEHHEWLEMFLFLRAHSSWLATSSITLSAQGPEAFMLMRGCLENALYAFYVSTDASLKGVWLARHDSEAAAKQVRDTFTIAKIKKALAQRDAALSAKVFQLYEHTIDEGAHPNVKAFFKNAVQQNESGGITLAVTYLNPDHNDELISATAEVGAIALELFKLVFGDLVE